MARNRIIYQCEGLYVGPAPSTGYHFISQYGTLGDSGDFNLSMPLSRIQSFNYTFTPRRTEVKELGWRSLVDNPIINTPEVTFEFAYLQAGVLNEHRLGLNANYSTGNYTNPYYSGNFNVSLISGFVNRSDDREQNDVRWPFYQTEPRNFFIPLASEGNDLNPHNLTNPTDTSRIYGVLGIGNSYMTSYRASASINSFPQAVCSYVGENIILHSSGTGVQVPAIESMSGTMVNRKFSVPPYNDNIKVSVLRPGDITVDIQAYSKAVTGWSGASGVFPAIRYALRPTGFESSTTPIFNLENSFTDIKIQSYDINLEFARQSLYHVNYKFPLDRPIQFPVYGTISIEAVVGDQITGSLYRFLRDDYDYGITIKMKNPAPYNGIGVQYDFKRAKLLDKSSALAIGPNRTMNARWAVDLDPDDLTKGFWISGEINYTGNPPIYIPDEFLLQEDGNYILQEDGISKIKIRGLRIY